MEEELKAVAPNRIAFVSFTKKAAEEAAKRATERFNFARSDLVYFRTIHSMAFMSLGLKRDQVMQLKDYKKIGLHLGLTFTGGEFNVDGPISQGKNNGDQYNFIDGFSRARHIAPRQVWDMINHDNLNWYEFRRYQDTVAQYKRDKGFHDFADMLEMGGRSLDVDVVIIDEAQDLSTAQWHYVTETFKLAKRIYIGGDDDQAIFEWSGADVGRFIDIEGTKTILSTSYRVPESVHTLATGITDKIKHRADKPYHSKEEKGTVDYWSDVDHIDMSSGTWLLLARNSYLLGELGAVVKQAGLRYTLKNKDSVTASDVRAIRVWEQQRNGLELGESDLDLIKDYCSDITKSAIWHEAFDKMQAEHREYYVSMLRRGESLTKAPRINISTIHGSKGGEADHVVLLTDMAYSTWDATSLNSDAEHRVWYVGATRAKQSLHIVQPRGRYYYDI